MGRDPHTRVETAVHTACVWEATARKVGNVHRYADFAGTTYLDFVLSAGPVASVLGSSSRNSIGEAIWLAVQRTGDVTRTNTNLGIVLLLTPLAAVSGGGEDSRSELRRILDGLTVADAAQAYQAIRLANPGGLGDAPEQDVRAQPTVTLLDAMKLAADRDLIARQYSNGFSDVLDFGVPAFLDAVARFGRIEPAIIECQLHWLATHPDSLIARKAGPTVALDVRRRAAGVLAAGGLDTPAGRSAGIELDRFLRSDGNRLNPGTTADLVTACLFVALLENKVKPSDLFRWDAPDWL